MSELDVGSFEDGKYLTFNLVEEIYGINVDHILQIIAIPQITPIPNTPVFVKGVINLRGKIIPVIDLRLRFELPAAEYNARTSIIIIKTHVGQDEVFIGIIVDTVLEVLDINASQIEPAPTFGMAVNTGYLHGMAKVKDKVVILLAIDNILSKSDLQSLNKQAQNKQ